MKTRQYLLPILIISALALSGLGCAVLLTGTDATGSGLVVNRLVRDGRILQTYNWPRFPGVYHGSGCTLAAACAARLALGEALADAVQRAQSYTWQTLGAGDAPGHGQRLPRRINP